MRAYDRPMVGRDRGRLRAGGAPRPVKASYARRRTVLGLWVVSSLWAVTVLADGELVRFHVLKSTYTGISVVAGAVAGPALLAIWYGFAGRPSMVVQGGRYFVSARTMTGVRTVCLDRLVSVRRYSTISRYGGYTDELRMRDENQVRLTVDNERPVSTQVRQAVRRAESRAGSAVTVTRHARTGLGLEPRSRLPEGLHRFWGLWLLMALFILPPAVSYAAACTIAGTGNDHSRSVMVLANGLPPGGKNTSSAAAGQEEPPVAGDFFAESGMSESVRMAFQRVEVWGSAATTRFGSTLS